MQEIINKLFELQDLKYQEFHSALCPGTNNIIGVRVPVLRGLAKEIAKSLDWSEFLRQAKNDYYEEIMLQGMVIGLAKMEIEERFYYLKKFIPKIDNWAVCDVTCAGLKFTNKHLEQVWDFIIPYINSQKEFEVRFGVVMLLDFYITPNYIERVLEIVNQVKHEGYYVKMAIAWAISICYIKFPKETMKLLQNNNFDLFTYNKALQKIIESYRVSEEEKGIIRAMKRKE